MLLKRPQSGRLPNPSRISENDIIIEIPVGKTNPPPVPFTKNHQDKHNAELNQNFPVLPSNKNTLKGKKVPLIIFYQQKT